MSSVVDSIKRLKRTVIIKSPLGEEKKVTIRVLPMRNGITVARKLGTVIAPAIGGTLDGLKHDDYVHGAPKSFANLALLLCDQIDKVGIESLIEALLYGMEINGNEVDLDEYFAGNYGELIEILEFALKENFSSFFTASGIKAKFMKTIGTLLEGMPQE